MIHLRPILNQEILQTVTCAPFTSCFGLVLCSLHGAALGNYLEAVACPECGGMGKIGHVVVCPHCSKSCSGSLPLLSYFIHKQLLNSLNKSAAKHSGRYFLSFCSFKGQLKQNSACRHMVQKSENYLKHDLLVKIGFSDM